jgi:hypothetical protein
MRAWLSVMSGMLMVTASAAVTVAPAALPVAPVWAGHPVEFDLLTRDGRQYVAFYDSNRWMCVAARAVQSNRWDIVRLPSQLGWDSHNYVTIALDNKGCLHVSGNMHNVPLIYFHSTRPHDIHALAPVQRMTGSNETSCTQPQFLVNVSNDLLFSFRDGHSGDAAQYVNLYDEATRTWRRVLDRPLLSGEGVRSAYPSGPVLGPDGWFHLAWVWRDTPDCATCHDLSYARSRDLLAWENAAGMPVPAPLTYTNATIVDSVPARGGLLNNIALSFDAQQRPIIAYQKNDVAGFTRLHYARAGTGGWQIMVGPAWQHRWRFGGMGCIVEDIKFRAVEPGPPHTLLQWYKHARYGEGIVALHADTCVATGMLAGTLRLPALEQVQSAFPGMLVKWRQGKGDQPSAGARYWLRWETLPENRDAARTNVPPPAMLRVHTLPTLAAQHLPLRPVPTFACTEPSASNVLCNSTLTDGLTGWLPWNKAREYPQAIARVAARGVPGATQAVRIINPWRALVGVQQLVPVVSGATYRLSGWARSGTTSDARVLFGGRVALYLPPQPEQQLVWMGECTQWTPQEKEFVNGISGMACVYVHMGYGGVGSTGEFADVRLERLEPPADGS